MAYRRIDPDVVEAIQHLLRTTNLSCRQIAVVTGVGRGVVDHQHEKGALATERQTAKLYRRCACGAMSRPIGKAACLACEIRQQGHQGTPAADVSVDLDLTDEHQARYEEMKILARARHEAGSKKSRKTESGE